MCSSFQFYGIFSLLDRHHSPLWQSKPADACNCDFSRFSWSGCHERIIICVRIIWREFISTLRKPANSPRCLLENWKFIVVFTKLHCGLYLGRARTQNRSIFKATDFPVKKCLLEDVWDVVALSRLRLYLFELHWYHFPAASYCVFLLIFYFILSIEGFQPKYCSDILGNTRLSSTHYIKFAFCV